MNGLKRISLKNKLKERFMRVFNTETFKQKQKMFHIYFFWKGIKIVLKCSLNRVCNSKCLRHQPGIWICTSGSFNKLSQSTKLNQTKFSHKLFQLNWQRLRPKIWNNSTLLIAPVGVKKVHSETRQSYNLIFRQVLLMATMLWEHFDFHTLLLS